MNGEPVKESKTCPCDSGNPSRNFDSEILEDIPAGKNARIIALEREKQYADKYRKELEDKYHKRP